MGSLRVDADRVYGPVHADASRQIAYHLRRVFFLEIDDLRALVQGHLQAAGYMVYREYPAGVHEQRARYGELADGPAPEDGHCIARLDLRDVSAEIPRREYVGDT